MDGRNRPADVRSAVRGAVRAATLAEPSKVESFRFSREWLRTQTMQASALRSSSVLRRLNLPPSYLLIHRVLVSGLGVLCQLECEAPFRAEVLRWMPGYADTAGPASFHFDDAAQAALMSVLPPVPEPSAWTMSFAAVAMVAINRNNRRV